MKVCEVGFWNFFLLDVEIGEGLFNFDYVYIVVELGKYLCGLEMMNCNVLDMGNMEVLECVGMLE